MSKKRKTVYRRGERISIYLKSDISDELLDWINSQREIGPSILQVLEKYISGEIVPMSILNNYIKYQSFNHDSDTDVPVDKEENIDNVGTDNIDTTDDYTNNELMVNPKLDDIKDEENVEEIEDEEIEEIEETNEDIIKKLIDQTEINKEQNDLESNLRNDNKQEVAKKNHKSPKIKRQFSFD